VILPTEYLTERLTPHPLPTKDGGVLRTVGDARTYILTLPKTRKSRAHWKRASLLLLQEVGAAALTWQVHGRQACPYIREHKQRSAVAGRIQAGGGGLKMKFILVAMALAASGFIGGTTALLADTPVTPAEAEKIKAALEGWNCSGGKMEKETEGTDVQYEVEDAKCRDGVYEIKLIEISRD
jgi:hypothetical protein